MLEALGNSVECMVCLDILDSVIRQCENGHSICDLCAKKLEFCPLCKSEITSVRNYKLEDVIASLKVMESKSADCKQKFDKANPVDHYQKCPNLNDGCDDISLYRYITNSRRSTQIELQAWNTLTIDQTVKDYYDIQLIAYNGGDELFWYKHKINVEKKEVYWLFQYLEPKVKSSNYYYEFTVSCGLSRILKIWELCETDRKSMDELIAAGQCITFPFKTLNNYLREDRKIYFKFNIVEIKEESENSNLIINQAAGNISNVSTQILPPDKKDISYFENEAGPSCSENHNVSPQTFQIHLLNTNKELESSINQNVNLLVNRQNFQGFEILPQHTNFFQQQSTPHFPVDDLNAIKNEEYSCSRLSPPRLLPWVSNNVSNQTVNQILDPSIYSSDNQIPSSTNFLPNQQVQQYPYSAARVVSSACNASKPPHRCRLWAPFGKRSIPADEVPLELVVKKRKHFQEKAVQRHKRFPVVHETVIDLTVTANDFTDILIDLTD